MLQGQYEAPTSGQVMFHTYSRVPPSGVAGTVPPYGQVTMGAFWPGLESVFDQACHRVLQIALLYFGERKAASDLPYLVKRNY